MKRLTLISIAAFIGFFLVSCSDSVEIESSVKKNAKGYVEISCRQNFDVAEKPHTFVSSRVNEIAGKACRGSFTTGKTITRSKTKTPGSDLIEVKSSFTCNDGKGADLEMSTSELCSLILRPNDQPLQDVL